MSIRSRLIQVYFSFQSLIAFGLLLILLAPSAGGSFLGYSLGRLGLTAPVFLLVAALLWATLKSWRKAAWLNRLQLRLDIYLDTSGIYLAVILIGLFISLAGLVAYQIGSSIQDSYFQGYFQKLSPFMLWSVAASVVTVIVTRFYRYGGDLKAFNLQKEVIKTALSIFGLLVIGAVFVVSTGIGLQPDRVGWGDPGSPILPLQVLWIAVFGVILIILRETWAERVKSEALNAIILGHFSRADLLDAAIFVILWLVTIWTWQSQPLQPGYFSPTPVAPNFEFYPYSDAANYDVSAHELLIGEGFGSDVRRPIYSLFLAAAQYFGGAGYESILAWQVPVLALIPALLYLLAKLLHQRISGLLVAILAIVHQSNAILLSKIINVSHVKLVMSDLPTTLGVIAFALVILLWLKQPARRSVYPLLAGGILALTMLIRIQVLILLPSMLIPIAWVFRHQKRKLLTDALLFLVGTLLVLGPWLWRGQQNTGNLSFAEAAQESQIGLIGDRYSLTPGESVTSTPLPDESSNQYSQRMLSSALRFLKEYPVEGLHFIAAHFIHNQVSTLLTLPASTQISMGVPYLEPKLAKMWEQCCSAEAYVRALAYWSQWDGTFLPQSAVPLMGALFLISVGIATAWKQRRILGLIPLWISVFYALGNALVRSSGWRFNLPVDWIGLLYFGIGLTQILSWVGIFFCNRLIPRKVITDTPTPPVAVGFSWGWGIFVGGILFLISLSIPIAEALIPARYTSEIPAYRQLSNELQSIGIPGDLPEFAAQNNLGLLSGRALYPRYYAAGKGIPENTWPAFIPRDYARLGFYLVGPNSSGVVLALEQPPAQFPHAADVIVLGCDAEEHLEAQIIILLGDPASVLVTKPPSGWGCASEE